ncbi:hypothetical protein M569_09187 [Genlisea aurea]|uniref:Hexosyltransferase n=1 Tax=Genlisea aurea TaxID=192259 RepID=S8CF83_9LAMI|nr:hypothetical protein M569_09187 [Genlisea aurea]
MKTRFRRFVFCSLVLTVVAPIVLYTDTLGPHFASPSKDELVNDLPTSAFSGDIRPLNVLPPHVRISSSKSKALVGSVNLEDSSNFSTGENTRITRQLTEESRDGVKSSSSLDENPIKRVTDEANLNKIGDPKGISDGSSKTEKTRRRRERHSPQQASSEHPREEAIQNALVLQLKDQLIQARIYLSMSATRGNSHFVRDLRLRVKEVQKALGDANKDSDLPKNAAEKSKAMEETLSKGKQIVDDCSAVVKKLRAMLHSTEEQLRVQRKQALFLTHLTAKTMPKGLHCLPLRLSRDYFELNTSQSQFPNRENIEDPKLYHYALFSDNVLAAAVVVNSTITHAKEPSKHVFHVVTDRLNYAAMRMWFIGNPPGEATIEVRNVEEFTWLNSSYSPVLRQLNSASMIDYYFKSRRADSDPNVKYRNPKYLSIMNHLRFYLPEIFPNLDKVLFLDDDVVVQKDLTGLWDLDMRGKVIGVVETCGENFHRFDRYLNFSHPLISKTFRPRACGWAFGMNIVDLGAWRKENITQVYHKWQNLNQERQLWKLGTLPPGLITFWNHTFSLEKSWHVLGLGYDPTVAAKDVDRASVIHYNGNLKPWLEVSIPKFRNYWNKYVDYEHVYLRECNISP